MAATTLDQLEMYAPRLRKGRDTQTAGMRIAKALQRHGVEVTFGQSLPSAFHLAAAELGIRQIAYREENAGGAMADGYARVSHKVSVVTAQNGPAATLLVPPLSEAYKASVPIIALVQEIKRSATDKNAFQEFDHKRLFQSCTKWMGRIDQPSRIDDYIDMAFIAASTGRPGPVVLLVPEDLLEEEVNSEQRRFASFGVYPLDRASPDSALIDEAARQILEARAPLVIAGGGVHISSASCEVAKLQENCHLPVATTNSGKGTIDENHPLSLGVIGHAMAKGSRTHHYRQMVGDADLVLLVGTRTDQNATDSWRLFGEHARFIHIDIDGTEIGRNYEALRLVGDARLTLAALTKHLLTRDLSKRFVLRAGMEKEIAAGRRAFEESVRGICSSNQKPIRPERLLRDLDRVLTHDTIVTADASYATVWAMNYLRSRGAGIRFLAARGLAGPGWGFPLALGAKVARPESPVICLDGDGGFAHCWAELETAVRLELPVVTIILNNQTLGYTKHDEGARFGAHTDATELKPVDHAAIARACGASGIRIEDPNDFQPALRDALERPQPAVLDVIVDPEAHPPITALEGRP